MVIEGASHPAPANPSPYNRHTSKGHNPRHAMHGIQHDGERMRGCPCLLDFDVETTLQKIFTDHTAVTLTEEEMAVGLLPSAHPSSLYITMRLLITGTLATILSLIGLTPNGNLSA